jgi:hypothetical protein
MEDTSAANESEVEERRRSERVQFFQLAKDKDIEPVWVFRQTYPESILGLLLDISSVGIQVLTNKSQALTAASYRMVVHAGNENVTLNVRRCWSGLEAARVKLVVASVMQPTVEYVDQPNASL